MLFFVLFSLQAVVRTIFRLIHSFDAFVRIRFIENDAKKVSPLSSFCDNFPRCIDILILEPMKLAKDLGVDSNHI